MEIRGEIARFLAAKQARELAARQLAAVQIACHVDISKVLDADAAERTRIILRLQRLLERERLRGARRHWSYDLNRHIALKQALDRLCSANGETPLAAKTTKRKTGNQSGARRRRLKLDDLACPKSGHPQEVSASSSSCGPGPSSWRAASGRRRSSALPSDSSDRDSTFHDTAQASVRSGSSGAA